MEKLRIREEEVQWQAIRAQGAGGQNVNKVSSAVHLRFDINDSSLPDSAKQALLNCGDQRITNDGVVVIKAQRHRTQERNRQDALQRLQQLLDLVTAPVKPRRPTKPSRAARERRMAGKAHKGKIKSLRGRPSAND